jgi:hypothetical protein
MSNNGDGLDGVWRDIESLVGAPVAEPARLAETAAILPGRFDFIRAYVNYADVLEAPPEAHEAIATELISSALCENVFIPHGADKIPLDLWLLLLSGSGFGRNTLVALARPVLKAAGLSSLIHSRTWGSRVAFYQCIAEHPVGLLFWPELSVVLKKFGDKAFAGAKEWLTDRYDNMEIPEAITYRVTGKKSDTPPIEFTQAPRLNILATSSLDWFLANVTQEDALGGFVPRWIVKQLDRGRPVPFPRRPDQSLIQPLAEHLHKANQLRGEADLSSIHDYYETWYLKTQRRFSEHPNSGLAMPFFNRLRTHVLKLAVIYEVSQSLSLKVRGRALGRAINAAKASEAAIFRLIGPQRGRPWGRWLFFIPAPGWPSLKSRSPWKMPSIWRPSPFSTINTKLSCARLLSGCCNLMTTSGGTLRAICTTAWDRTLPACSSCWAGPSVAARNFLPN